MRPAPTPFSLRQLSYFLSAIDRGTVSAAAAEHGVSPSIVSAAITDLERRLEVALCIRRRGRGVTLTAAGADFAPRARALLRSAEDLTASVSRHGDLSGPLRVGCYPTLAPVMLPLLHYDFRERYPGIGLTTAEITQDAVPGALTADEIDVAVVFGTHLPPDMPRATLYHLPIHVLLAAEHPLAQREEVALADLVDEDLFLLDSPPSGEHTLALFAERGLHPRIRHRTSSYESVRALVARGGGYAVQIQRPASMASYAGSPLTSVAIDRPFPPVDVDVVWSADRQPSARVRALIDFAQGVDWRAHQPAAIPQSAG